jgi:cytochrome c-type biogenesis protein
VDTSTLGFALAAGLVAVLNPCGYAMLPSYLTLVVLGTGERQSRSVVVAGALAATVAMAAGFLVVFALFGLIVAPLASQVQRYLPIVTITRPGQIPVPKRLSPGRHLTGASGVRGCSVRLRYR